MEATTFVMLVGGKGARPSGASSAAWTIKGSAAGWSFAASSIASANVFATDLLRPQADFDGLGNPAPGRRIRGDQTFRSPATRQIGFDRIRIDRIVIDEQNTFALLRQPLHHGGKRGLLLILRANQAEPHAERHKIGAHGGVRLRKRLLNHASGQDVTAGYIVMDVERLRAPMQKIADYLVRAMGIDGSTVISIDKAGGAS
jgi:hypothetical protein